MVAVDGTTALKYGFRLLGYLVAVFIAGGVLWLVGAGFAPTQFQRGNPIAMTLFVLAGVAVVYAGGLGLLYKVIADGVEAGQRAAERPPQPQGGYAGGGQPAQGSQGDGPPQGGHPSQGQQR